METLSALWDSCRDPRLLILSVDLHVGALLPDGSKAKRILGGDQKEAVAPDNPQTAEEDEAVQLL